ncbi:MAG: AAC(3) family N-acetyltransferase [Oscillospiraceae bacterium]
MVHSSMKALGIDGEGPELVIKALQEVLTDKGTLLMPALTYSTVTRANPNFSYHDSPVCVGLIPETFRKSKGVIRSFNPVHSVCAWGKYAKEMTENHKLDVISIGKHSPYCLLPQYDGKILMMGCGLRPNTFIHGIENVAKAPYREIKYIVQYTMEDAYGNSISYEGHLPDMSQFDQRYDRVTQILSHPDIKRFSLLQAESYLIDSQALMSAGVKAIKEDPYYFVDKL